MGRTYCYDAQKQSSFKFIDIETIRKVSIVGGDSIKDNKPIALGIIVLFILSALAPLVVGFNIASRQESTIVKDPLEDYYGVYSLEEIPESIRPVISEEESQDIPIENNVVDSKESPILLDGPMDSPWSMYCHDTHHTGRSPYSTIDNSGLEKWQFDIYGPVWGGPVIDEDGILYVGTDSVYALYPNGTLKWSYEERFRVSSTPIIDENGVLYIGAYWSGPQYMYAIYKNNGTLKWKFYIGDWIASSPAIGLDGTIYFGSENDYIYSLFQNGTLKWKYQTSIAVYSSPAIGDDGTIYCGSHDTYLYALYPNNGTLKWRYKTGNWIRTSPCIADDGTIYVVSLDDYLHAVNPNGTMKWKTNVGAGTSPTIGQDGTIYCGYDKLNAVNPTNGSVKWTFDVKGKIRGATPCNSIDGTIYLGNSDGSDIVAVNPDGTEKWRVSIGGDVESAPAIGEDGTVYIGDGLDKGHIYAFGRGPLEADANGPYYGLINEPVKFSGSATGGYSPYSYHWDFGDANSSDIQNPQQTYTSPDNYTVILTVTDNSSNTSEDTTWAWIQDGNYPPILEFIDGPTKGTIGISYDYIFRAVDPEGANVWFIIDWDDGSDTDWLGPYSSGQQVTLSHTWINQGTYTIKGRAKDPYDDEGPWGELQVTMPRDKATTYSLLQRWIERYPLLNRLLSLAGMI